MSLSNSTSALQITVSDYISEDIFIFVLASTS